MPDARNTRRLLLTLFCGALFALPFVVIVYQAATVMNSQSEFSRKEQYGLIYHRDLLNFVESLQELRDTAIRGEAGDQDALTELSYKKKDVLQAADEVEKTDGNISQNLGVTPKWLALRQAVTPYLERENIKPTKEDIKSCHDALDALGGLMNDVADSSNLTLDPSLDTDYMADAMVITTPEIITTLGKLREAAIIKSAADEKIQRMKTLDLRLAVYQKEMRRLLERARKNGKKYTQQAIDYEKKIEPSLEDIRNRINDGTLDPVKRDAEVTELASESIDTFNAFYDDIATGFLALLKQRDADYSRKRDLVLASTIVGFVGFVALIVFLFHSLSRAERGEQEVKRYLGELEAQRLQLIKAKADADSANAAKSDFLANMSHELRTPLNSILGMTALLQESGLQGEQQELADTVYHSSVNLLEIVNDILDLSKIEASEMRLEHIGFDIAYVFDSVVFTLNHVASRKNILLTKNYDKSQFPYVLGDPLRMTRVLTNLIGNAIKYTDRGAVEFSASCRNLDNKHVEILCEIKDTGIGIPEDKHEHIFSKFGQADTSTTRKYGGTGLGLAITKQLVELMGGKIGLQSEIGMGSTFWFTVPLEVTNEIDQESRSRRHRKGAGSIPRHDARVLVAEDHPVNQLFIRKVLQKFGIGRFEIVKNGLEALERYKTEQWDVILLDGHMPGLNGYDTTTKIRGLEKGTERHVPIVAMTANAMIGEREKCLSYGMDDYISKPIDIQDLQDILGQWLHFDEEDADHAIAAARLEVPADLTQLRTFTDGDRETEKELVEAFLEQSEKNLAVLEKNRSGADEHAWTEAAHMLKGGAGGVGAYELQRLSNEAQHFAGTIQRRAALYREILEEFDRVKRYLKSVDGLSQ